MISRYGIGTCAVGWVQGLGDAFLFQLPFIQAVHDPSIHPQRACQAPLPVTSPIRGPKGPARSTVPCRQRTAQDGMQWDVTTKHDGQGWLPGAEETLEGAKTLKMLPKSAAQANYCLRSAKRWKDHRADTESYYEHSWGLPSQTKSPALQEGSADKSQAGWMSWRLQLKSQNKPFPQSPFSCPFPKKIAFLATRPCSKRVSLDSVCHTLC